MSPRRSNQVGRDMRQCLYNTRFWGKCNVNISKIHGCLWFEHLLLNTIEILITGPAGKLAVMMCCGWLMNHCLDKQLIAQWWGWSLDAVWWMSEYIIPHLTLSFFILYISAGCHFAIFCVILIMPAATVVICTKYGPGKWHATIFFKMRILRHCFVQCGIDFMSLPFTFNSTLL